MKVKKEKLTSVELENQEPSYADFFKKVELLPLETTDQSLVANVSKILEVDGKLVVFDNSRRYVKVFSDDGRYLNDIGKLGQGPEEYTDVYDVTYNSAARCLTLLSPFGEVVNYSPEGKFVDRFFLPSKPNYWSAEWIDADRIALWSGVDEDEPGVTVYDRKTDETVMEGWYNCFEFDFTSQTPFFRCDDTLRFSEPFGNRVFELTADSLSFAYEWDFGKSNISEQYRQELAGMADRQARRDMMKKDFGGDRYRYNLVRNMANKRYLVSLILTRPYPDLQFRTVIYDLGKDSGICLDRFKEGMSFRPVFMNEEYVVCEVPYDEIETYNRLFGYSISQDEDSNVILAKYHFL